MERRSDHFHGVISVECPRPKFIDRLTRRLIVRKTIHQPLDDGMYFYSKYITLRNGKRLYAAHYGLQAFKLRVRGSNKRR